MHCLWGNAKNLSPLDTIFCDTCKFSQTHKQEVHWTLTLCLTTALNMKWNHPDIFYRTNCETNASKVPSILSTTMSNISQLCCTIIFTSLICQSVLLYYQPFSCYNPFWDNFTEWAQLIMNTTQQLLVSLCPTYISTHIYGTSVQNFNPFRSAPNCVGVMY